MRILHATDFSRTAELARALALDLARRTATRLHVVHVQERSSRATAAATCRPRPTPSTRSCSAPRGGARDRDPAPAAAAEPLRQRRRDHRTRLGHTLRELLRLAAEFDLVVMGAHGQNPFDDVFLGGVAGRLVRRTTTPVLTVRQTCTTTAVRRLLVATDFQEAALAAWTFANWFADRSGVKLVLAHVHEGPPGEAGSAQARLETLAADRAERIVIGPGNPIEALPQLATEVGADAIVVGMRATAPSPA
jgi:nucleotide-binding universal stress UspA family protein